MAWITYIAADGKESRVDVRNGNSLMLGAVQNNVYGIDGECGGCLSCATCHVYLDPEWQDRVPAADEMESEMLEQVAAERRPTSRLSCQIHASPELDGMRVFMPETQS
jgi:ferredoxin, 2Fe-2S